MSLSRWDEGSDSDQVTGLDRDSWLVGHRKILAWQLAKLPRYRREGAVGVRPFPAKKRLLISEAQGLSSEAMKRNPTTVIPGVDESKSKSSNNRRPDRTLNSITGEPWNRVSMYSRLIFRARFNASGRAPRRGVMTRSTQWRREMRKSFG